MNYVYRTTYVYTYVALLNLVVLYLFLSIESWSAFRTLSSEYPNHSATIITLRDKEKPEDYKRIEKKEINK